MKILYVEDSEGCRFVMGKFLQGHDVRMVGTGEEGVEVAVTWGPDLVLVDLNLPGMNGYEMARAIKAARDVPVVVVTASVMVGALERARSAGCDDFLDKPLLRKEVLAVIERWKNGTDPAR